jgi:MFS transporter, DHA2 family, multidrug resistance protein
MGGVAAALGLLSFSSVATAWWLVVLSMFAAGLGLGLFYPSNNYSYMASAPAGRRGIASAFLGTLRTVGGTMGAALTTALFAAATAILVTMGSGPAIISGSSSTSRSAWTPERLFGLARSERSDAGGASRA